MLIPAPQAPPEATGPAGDLFAPAIHLMKRSFQIKLAPSIFISGEQCRPHHHMVLRPVHMAKGQIHHPPDNGHRGGRGPGKTHSEDAVHALGVAVTAHIVSLYAAGLAGLLSGERLRLCNKRAARYVITIRRIQYRLKQRNLIMLKNLSGKVRALLIAGIAAVVVLAAVLTGSLALRVDAAQAQEKALAAAGGGEVVGQEIDQEGPWNEYSFDIVNGDVWYEVEVNAFGRVNGLESGQAGYGDYSHWE